MSKSFGAREKFFALNGLVSLVQALENKYTTVDLRNETSVFGKVKEVDVFMNISMTNAVFINGKGEKFKFDNFFIQSRNVRYVHIPEEIPILGAIEKQLKTIVNVGRGQRSEDKSKSWKSKRAVTKQIETIKMIEKIKEENQSKKKKLQSE